MVEVVIKHICLIAKAARLPLCIYHRSKLNYIFEDVLQQLQLFDLVTRK
jgi:hypothetical protein